VPDAKRFERGASLLSCCPFIHSVSLNLHFREFVPTLAISVVAIVPCIRALISAAPHYGLRYGSAPATGNFQRLRGRPPLVSPLKSCMGRSFTA
jgi:hypothetical protein